MALGALLMLFYPSMWVYGKVSQAVLQREWQHEGSTSGQPALSGIFGRLVIPKLWMDQVVLEGVGDSELARGPAHFPQSAIPGDGNCVIIGHLNIDGSPFKDLDKLRPGDEVLVQAHDRLVSYSVATSRVISPTDVSVVAPSAGDRLVLLTCTPGAKHRLAVFCRQVRVQ
jgi:sortase A